MPEPDPLAAGNVYQLRVVLRGVSPLIWRRLLVRSDSTIADLHRALQIAFGWSDEHLHRFVIHGRIHGGESLVDPRRVRRWPTGYPTRGLWRALGIPRAQTALLDRDHRRPQAGAVVATDRRHRRR